MRLHTKATTKRLTILAMFCAAPATTLAQPTNVALSWEFSADNGATWVPNSIAVLGGNPATVRVRAVMSWQSHTSTFDGFGGINLDPFVAHTPGSGEGDWILDPLTRHNGGLQSPLDVGVFAFPDLLKLDRLTDALSPGEGTGWLAPIQIPNFEGFSIDNPIEILRYSYSLDGTPGTRTVSAALALSTDGPRSTFYDLDFGFSPQFVPVSQLSGTITVIPAPAPLALVALAGGLTMSRKRRR